MAFKFVTLLALVAAANAGFIPVAPSAYAAAPVAYAAAAPIAKTVLTKTVDAEYDHHPQYNYAYDVQDSLTGDFKSQHESRDGDVVHGSYSLVEADGSRRIVDYTADPANGFNAVVRKEPAQVAVKAVAAAPIAAYAAPAIAKIHPAPAPIAKIATYAAPAAYAARPLAPAAYAAPAAYGAPLAYAAPAPYAKIAGPISYISHVSYSTPLFSYSH